MSQETDTQVQTESTNLAVVEESVLGAITPPTTGWFNLDPNGYGEFGPSYKKQPRRPISRNQQLRKGMLTGMDSGITVEFDVTKHVIDRFAAGMFRCKPKHSGGTGQSLYDVVNFTATGIGVASNGTLQAKTLVYVRGADNDANNGLFEVNSGSTSTEIKVTGLVTETPTGYCTVEVAGFRFATDDATLDSSGNVNIAAANWTTMGLNVEQWVYFGGRATANSFLDDRIRGAAKIKAITATKLTLEKRTWAIEFLDLNGVATGNIDTVVESRSLGTEVDITLQIIGDGTGAGTLTESGFAVVAHVQVGVTTVAQFEALINSSSLIKVRTADATGSDLVQAGDVIAATPIQTIAYGPDAATSKRIEVFFTRWYRNVPIGHSDHDKPSYAFEVEFPELETGTEWEYLLGNAVSEVEWNFPTEGKSTVRITFVGTRTLNPTATRKTGPATAKDPNTQEGVSTSTDLQRLRYLKADETGISTDFESLKITQKNNLDPQKQLARLGAKRLNHGEHEAAIEADVIFTSTQVIKMVRSNETGSLDILMRNPDFGALYELQALTVDAAGRKLEKNKGVTITSKATGFQKKLSTDSLSVFAFLPALPEDSA